MVGEFKKIINGVKSLKNSENNSEFKKIANG